jgi:hypothetical protein
MGAFLCVTRWRDKKKLRLDELTLGLLDTSVKSCRERVHQRLVYFGL